MKIWNNLVLSIESEHFKIYEKQNTRRPTNTLDKHNVTAQIRTSPGVGLTLISPNFISSNTNRTFYQTLTGHLINMIKSLALTFLEHEEAEKYKFEKICKK